MLSPVYSPISSGFNVVLSRSSFIHCLTAITFGAKIKVDVWSLCIAPIPTIVFPAPQGSTITPEPPFSLPPAWNIATENEINAVGYQYLNAKNYDKAIETFKMNTEKHPDSWNVYDSLAEAYEKSGNKEMALENYEKALKMADDQTQKDRINKTIQNLKYPKASKEGGQIDILVLSTFLITNDITSIGSTLV